MNLLELGLPDDVLNERSFETIEIDGQHKIVITEDSDFAKQCKNLLVIAQDILVSHEVRPFYLVENKKSINKSIGMTRLGKRIQMAMQIDDDALQASFKYHRFHPLIELVVRIGRELDLFRVVWELRNRPTEFSTEYVSTFNKFVVILRTEARTRLVKKSIASHERNAHENFVQFQNYINAHFRKRSRLLFVRLDVSYKRNYIEGPATTPEAVYRRIKSDWSKLHRDLSRKMLKKDLRGFVWKLEYGILKSFHMHVLLILDSSELASDITIGGMIGDHWKKQITLDAGDYFNCNQKKASYRFCAVGQVHRDDVETRKLIDERIGTYLSKPDYVVALQAPDGGRTFGKGNMPT